VNSEVGKCIRHKKRQSLWNLPPINLKNIHPKSLFKKKLKELFLQSLDKSNDLLSTTYLACFL